MATAVRPRVAVVRGTALIPGKSKNGRLYTEENIASAYARLTERLADPEGRPVTMRSFHPDPASKADMSVGHIAGRVTEVSLEPGGRLRWVAELADTESGRDVAALMAPDDSGKPRYLSNVSIRGRWLSPIYKVDGCETADDLEVDGIDFTPNPGVTGARIENARLTEAVARTEHAITESVEDCFVETTAETPEAPEKKIRYADPGYRSDSKARYPMETVSQVIWGLAHIAEDANAAGYTDKQLRRVRTRLRGALSEHGVDLANEESRAAAYQSLLDEAYASTNLDNGAGDIRVSAWINDPADLPAVGRRVALAAMAGLLTLDPDNDGDIDLDDGSDADGAEACTACAVVLVGAPNFCPECGAPVVSTEGAPTSSGQVAEETRKEGTTMPDETKATDTAKTDAVKAEEQEAADAAKAAEEAKDGKADEPTALTEDAIAAAVAKGVSEALAALKPAAAPAAEETSTEKTVAELVAEQVAEQTKAITTQVREDVLKAYGPPKRKGLVPVDETAAPSKPLHEMSDEEFKEHRKAAFEGLLPL